MINKENKMNLKTLDKEMIKSTLQTSYFNF